MDLPQRCTSPDHGPVIPVAYRELLRRADVRSLLGVAMIARIPHTAAGMVLMYHVVDSLDRSYGEAGAVVAAFTLGIGIGAPWRGRLVDRVGLRRALMPSIIGEVIVWPLAGVVPFLWLFPVAFIGGLLALPIFSVVRKALSIMVEPRARRTAYALDSVGTELLFMVGPALGLWCSHQVGTAPVLAVIGLATSAAGVLLWRHNPVLTRVAAPRPEPVEDAGPVSTMITSAPTATALSSNAAPDASTDAGGPDAVSSEASSTEHGPWMSTGVAVILALSAAAALALSGTEVSIVAELRELDHEGVLGTAIAAWCAASAVGGFIYGAVHRSISPTMLVLLLGILTAPLVLARSVPTLIALLVVAGLLCAPATAATTEALTRHVPEARRGEAMGWQGTAFTTGSAIGAPIAGMVIDWLGPSSGFGSVAVLAVLVAAVGGLVQRRSGVGMGQH